MLRAAPASEAVRWLRECPPRTVSVSRCIPMGINAGLVAKGGELAPDMDVPRKCCPGLSEPCVGLEAEDCDDENCGTTLWDRPAPITSRKKRVGIWGVLSPGGVGEGPSR